MTTNPQDKAVTEPNKQNWESLREQHPTFRYESVNFKREGRHLVCRFQFILEPDITFTPEVSFEYLSDVDEKQLSSLVFHLGLVELISYWKAACSPVVQINAGCLQVDQIRWWHDLFIHGLGEFYCRNQIDFTAPDFLTIRCNQDAQSYSNPIDLPNSEGSLIMAAGGKDSAVTLELFAPLTEPKAALILNPTRAALESAQIANYREPLVIRRRIDPELLRLNKIGYLNGHTPFSAYLAFSGIIAAAISGYKQIVVSNERSSSQPNTYFLGLAINHQYSKSYRFEELFRQYCNKYLTPSLSYFSFLRPIFDLQVAALFANFPQHFSSFRSCNVGQQTDSWCGRCPKCAFVYLSLFPFLDESQVKEIFGDDYFQNPEIQQHIRGLVGLEEEKPFECVGTHEESRYALKLCGDKYRDKFRDRNFDAHFETDSAHSFIANTLKELKERQLGSNDPEFSFTEICDRHFIPDQYFQILVDNLSEIANNFDKYND